MSSLANWFFDYVIVLDIIYELITVVFWILEISIGVVLGIFTSKFRLEIASVIGIFKGLRIVNR